MHELMIEIGPELIGKIAGIGDTDDESVSQLKAMLEAKFGEAKPQPEEPLEDITMADDEAVLATALSAVKMLNEPGYNLQDVLDEEGNLKRVLFGRADLDEVTDEEREQAEIDGVTISLSNNVRMGLAYIDAARERYGDLFSRIEADVLSLMAESATVDDASGAVLDPIRKRHNAELAGLMAAMKALSDRHRKEFDEAAEPFNRQRLELKPRQDAIIKAVDAAIEMRQALNGLHVAKSKTASTSRSRKPSPKRKANRSQKQKRKAS